MTGSRAQLYNGILLLAMFFSCRLVWGTYQSVRVYQDVWAALNHKPTIPLAESLNGTSAARLDMMKFTEEEYIPVWLALTYLASNLVLNTLNFFWFAKMIETVRKRFQPPKEVKTKQKAIAVKSTGANGKTRIDLDETEVRRRIIVDDEPAPAAA